MLALLGFDDDYTLYKQVYFRDCNAVRYSVLIEIVDSAYDLVYGRCTCQMYPRKLDKENRLRCQM